MKILHIMTNDKSHESIQPACYILHKKGNGVILKRQESRIFGGYINLLNESMIF